MNKKFKNLNEAIKDATLGKFQQYTGRSGWQKMGDVRVEARLTQSSVHGQYEGITVIIYNIRDGEIARQYFPFKDYLVMAVPHQNIKELTHIVDWRRSDCGIEWYGNDPSKTSLTKLYNAMESWIELWT